MLNTFRTELQEFWKEKELQEPTPVQEQLFKEASQGNEHIMLNTNRNELQEFWKEKELQEPTPVQEQLFKEASQGNDVIAVSPTGTGKTLAYLLPILNQIEANKTLQAIILAPSQELV